jgi:hypothetical protein
MALAQVTTAAFFGIVTEPGGAIMPLNIQAAGFKSFESSGIELAAPDYTGGDPINPNRRRDGIYLNRQAFALGPGRNPIRPGNVGVGVIRGPAKLQIRADAYNAFNYTPYSGFTTGINLAIFGALTSNAGARQVQLNARISF